MVPGWDRRSFLGAAGSVWGSHPGGVRRHRPTLAQRERRRSKRAGIASALLWAAGQLRLCGGEECVCVRARVCGCEICV